MNYKYTLQNSVKNILILYINNFQQGYYYLKKLHVLQSPSVEFTATALKYLHFVNTSKVRGLHHKVNFLWVIQLFLGCRFSHVTNSISAGLNHRGNLCCMTNLPGQDQI